MSTFGDEFDEMTDGSGTRRGAGGATAAGDDDVTRFLTELRGLGDGPAPEPSPELAALLGGAAPLLGHRTALRIALRTMLVAAAVITALVVAAANHSLPAPAQRVVSNVVNVLTPFHIGGPAAPSPVEPPRPSDKPLPPVPAPPSRPRTTAPAAPPPGAGQDDSPRARPSAGHGAEDGPERGSPTAAPGGDAGGGDAPSAGSDGGRDGGGDQAPAPSASAPASGGEHDSAQPGDD